MHLKNQPPIFVPAKYRAEIEKHSKAALMDMVWDLATRCTLETTADETIMDEVRSTAEIIQTHRRQTKAEGK